MDPWEIKLTCQKNKHVWHARAGCWWLLSLSNHVARLQQHWDGIQPTKLVVKSYINIYRICVLSYDWGKILPIEQLFKGTIWITGFWPIKLIQIASDSLKRRPPPWTSCFQHCGLRSPVQLWWPGFLTYGDSLQNGGPTKWDGIDGSLTPWI